VTNPTLQNNKKYSQNTTIIISYERVDHIAVYNYLKVVTNPVSLPFTYFMQDIPLLLDS